MRTLLRYLLVMTVFVYTSFASQGLAYTPAVGSKERKAVLSALRAAVQRELKKPVVFGVDHLKVQGGWAFMRGMPRHPSGKPMNYQGTPYQEAIEQGIFDDWICALLRKQHGRWRVVAYVIGATDVPYAGWAQQYRAPPGIFE
jgi:hypothetical protein